MQPDKAAGVMTRQQRMVRIGDLWTRGCTNKTQIAAALGVATYVISKDMKCIMQGWKRENRASLSEQLALRIQMLQAITYEARNGFDRSRQESQEHSATTKTCDTCRGVVVENDDGEREVCPTCSGNGVVVTETIKSSGQSGNPAFLRVAALCTMEVAKLQGHYHPRQDPGLGSVYRTEITNVHNQINIADGGPNPFAKAAPQMILEAKAALARLTESARDVDDEDFNVIEVEAE